MLNKKKLYIIGGIVVLVIGYLNYYGDEKGPKNISKTVETKGVKYNANDYKIDAGEQIDYIDKGESSFKTAKAVIKGMILSGDNAFLDKVKNLSLDSNILGISPNGWDFKAQNINYDKSKDEITSKTGVFATNKKLNMSIAGKEFITDTKMSYIEMQKEVTLENEKIKVVGDIGNYNDETKRIVLKDNVFLESKKTDDKYKEKVTGNFKQLNYDLNTKIIEGMDPYTLHYGENTLHAEKLFYNQKDESFLITENVSMDASDFKIFMDKIEKKPMSDIVTFYGKIKGSNPKYDFESDNGNYNMTSEKLELVGNVIITSKEGQKLTADKIEYDTKTEVITAIGIDKNAIYTNENQKQELQSKKIVYDTNLKTININQHFEFKKDENHGTGEKLIYNELSKEGAIDNPVLFTKDRKITTFKIEYKGNENMLYIPSTYRVETLSGDSTFDSKNATYNLATKEFLSPEDYIYNSKGNIINGKNIIYNSETGIGETKEKIRMENMEQSFSLLADSANFKANDYIELLGNLNISNDEYTTKADKAKYTFKDSTLRIPQVLDIKGAEDKTVYVITNPEFNTETSMLSGTNYKGDDGTNKSQADIFKYDQKNEILYLKNNAIVSNSDTTLKGNDLEYATKEKIAKAKGKYNLIQNNLIVDGVDIVFNSTTGDVHGGKIKMVSKDTENKIGTPQYKEQIFEADKSKGNVNNSFVDFTGNAKGRSYSGGKPVDYAGKLVRVYVDKVDKGYDAKRVELLGDSTMTQDKSILYSKYTDIDLKANIAYSNQRPKMITDSPDGKHSEVESDRAEMHMNENITYIYDNVLVTSIDPKKGKTVATSKKGAARSKEKIVELEDTVVIDSPDAIVYADKAEYNTDTKKIRAHGAVKVDYKKK